MKTKLLPLMLLAGIALSGCGTADTAADSFVRVENGQFLLNDKPYYFIGTNFWYGPILGSQGPDGDRGRLARELDALRDRGVTNLRVLVGADGEEGVPCKSSPSCRPHRASTTMRCSTGWTTSCARRHAAT